ncbi:MAG: triose-phosphate isomerase [Pseudomonadales bacterium]|nr:triose-phosphate isomerase [Pseudomonadales bacterium]
MRKPIVAGNWKMNGSRASIEALLNGVLEGLKAVDSETCEVLVFPPSLYLQLVVGRLASSAISVGAQNIDWHESGAYTGEVSAAMVKDSGADFVIVGHSERRSLYGETDDMVAAKVAAAIDGSLIPVVCVGETLMQRQAGETRVVVEAQLQAVTDRIGAAGLSSCIVAYEPVWAIGTGESATPEQAGEVHDWIREALCRVDTKVGKDIRILYGGSVNAANAAELFAIESVDGALVGGASLLAGDFTEICQAAGQRT